MREVSVYSDDSCGSDTERASPGLGLVLENPDGSFSHALPSGTHYKRASTETPPLDRSNGDWVIWDPILMERIEQLYGKHERVFILLLVFQFMFENAFNLLLLKHREDTVAEIGKVYPFLSQYGDICFWIIMSITILFECIYYISGGLAVWERRSVYMRVFTDIAIVGIIGQIFFAYINRFNLIIFFLRFVIFTHARFLFAILTGNARIVINGVEPIILDP